MPGSSGELRALVRGPITAMHLDLGWPQQDGAGRQIETSTDARVERVCRRVVDLLRASPGVATLEVSGLAPGRHGCFRALVSEVHALGRRIVHRVPAAALGETVESGLPPFLAAHGVVVHATMPCVRISAARTEGASAFHRGVEGLRALNGAGYGCAGSSLELILSHNPSAADRIASRALEDTCRRELRRDFGVEFTRLEHLVGLASGRRAGALHQYGAALQRWLNPLRVSPLTCLSSVAVRWDGRLFDCGFNQALSLAIRIPRRRRLTVLDLRSTVELEGLPVTTAPHCFGCTTRGCRRSASVGAPSA